jgi:hypothetical protein
MCLARSGDGETRAPGLTGTEGHRFRPAGAVLAAQVKPAYPSRPACPRAPRRRIAGRRHQAGVVAGQADDAVGLGGRLAADRLAIGAASAGIFVPVGHPGEDAQPRLVRGRYFCDPRQ